MKIRELILESTNTNILVVDVQPAYHAYAKRIIYPLFSFLNKQQNNIYALFNANGLTDDTLQDVQWYYMENGVEEETVNRIQFIEKDYGFFRAWMDNGVPNSIIIKTIRIMVQSRINDSRDLNLEEILDDNEMKYMDKVEYDPLFIPDFMPISILKQISPFYMCGGGRNECLREIEILCNAFNIRYKRMNDFIY